MPNDAQAERFTDLNRIPTALELGSHRVEFIYFGVLGSKWWRNYLHVHSFFEICYAYGGRGSFTIGGRRYSVRPGEMFIARPGEPHEIISDRRKPLGIYYWAFSVAPITLTTSASAPPAPSPTPAPPPTPATESIDALLGSFIASPVGAPARVIAKTGSTMHHTLRLLTDEVALRRPGFTRAIDGLLAKLILDSARSAAPSARGGEAIEPPAAHPAEAVTRTAIRYLVDNLALRFEIRDVAAQVGLSERQLGRLFRQVTGKTILAYLTHLRLERARQLLLDRDLPIKQVARAVGYPDTHYFTTLFGKRTGMTPGQFRRSGGTLFLKTPLKSPRKRPRE
jgi:AraC family L-rhamnose operon transcriptional activator RhaR